MIIQSILRTSFFSSAAVSSPTACWLLRKRSASSPPLLGSSTLTTLPASMSECGTGDESPDFESRITSFSVTCILMKAPGMLVDSSKGYSTTGMECMHPYLYIILYDPISHAVATTVSASIELNAAYQLFWSTFPYQEPCERRSRPIRIPDNVAHRAGVRRQLASAMHCGDSYGMKVACPRLHNVGKGVGVDKTFRYRIR
jgi:hypothetical protein